MQRDVSNPAPKIHFLGLLFVNPAEEIHENIRSTATDPLDIYFGCAALCASSAAATGHHFSVITNKRAVVLRRLQNAGFSNVPVIYFDFRWEIPKNIPFYSAHFKLELIEALASGQFGDHVGLIDIDTVFINPLCEAECCQAGSLKAYDISDQIFPHFGFDRVRRDLESVAASSLDDPRWYGGEFLVGDTASFGHLSELIAGCWRRYLQNIGAFHHTGDEMIVSAALNLAAKNGLQVFDIGRLNGIARWWSSRTGFRQRTFDQIKTSSILHLPSDKEFLAAQARRHYNSATFLASYERYARPRLFVRQVYDVLSFSRENPRKYVGALKALPKDR